MTIYESLEEMLIGTQNHNWHHRALAAKALATRRESQGVEALIALLNDPIQRVREEAARSLATIGNERAIKPLIECFIDPHRAPEADEDGDVSWAIPEALKRFGAQAIQELLPYLQDLPKAWRDSVLWLMGYLAHPVAVAPLIEAYGRATHVTERHAICRSLSQINSPQARQFLEHLDQTTF